MLLRLADPNSYLDQADHGHVPPVMQRVLCLQRCLAQASICLGEHSRGKGLTRCCRRIALVLALILDLIGCASFRRKRGEKSPYGIPHLVT